MKKKFQVINSGETNSTTEKSKLSNAEMIIGFLKDQVSDLEEHVKSKKNLPLQKAIVIYCFGETDSLEDSLQNFQFISIDMPTPEFFLLIEKMKLKYLYDLDDTIPV